MRVTMLRRLVPGAALLVLLFLAAPVDAASVTYENEYVTETVYRGGQQPFTRNTRVRRVHRVNRHHHRAGSPIGYNGAVTSMSDNVLAVPDGGSTFAMMFASTALLLLGYHRVCCKRIAA